MVFNVIFKNNLVSEHMMSCMVMSELNLFCLEVNGHKIVVSQDITITIYPTGTTWQKKNLGRLKYAQRRELENGEDMNRTTRGSNRQDGLV